MSQVPLHDPASCERPVCRKCQPQGVPQPPKPVDHDVRVARKPQGRRELDLGRLVQQVGRRLEREGQAAALHFAEWEREGKIPPTPPACALCDGRGCEDCHGTGDAPPAFDSRVRQQKEIRAASELRGRFLKAQVRLGSVLVEIERLLDQATIESKSLDRHRTPAQVEVDGFCGNCWAKAGVLVEVTLRPSGEPWYRGRCRGCGSYRGENGVEAPADVVGLRLRGREPAGKKVRVKAS